MDVKLLQIDTTGDRPTDASEFDVRVLVEIDGHSSWYGIGVRPNILAGFDASLLVPREELEEALRHEQYALHRICKLIGRELRGKTVRVPQQIAA